MIHQIAPRISSRPICIGLVAIFLLHLTSAPALALRIRDVARLKNEVPNELVGMGLVVGLKGTGDGGDFLPTMRPLKEMMKRFDDPVTLDKELKNANNVAIVSLSMKIPPHGAHSGEALDVKVSALAAKSLRGGHLFIVPMFAPRTDAKIVVASASGDLLLEDETNPTSATIKGGGVLIEDVLPDEIVGNQFTLVLHPQDASPQLATAVAEQINEEVAPQAGDKPTAVAVDATSVTVTIPAPERNNITPFISRLMDLPLPSLPEPARVRINTVTKTIIFTDEVELAPTTINHGNLTITISEPEAGRGSPAAGPNAPHNAKLKDLENAFNTLKVSAEDRIAIVKELYNAHVLKAELIIE